MKENDLDPDVTAQYRAGLLTKFEYLLIKHRLRRIRKLLQFLHGLRVYIWFRFWWARLSARQTKSPACRKASCASGRLPTGHPFGDKEPVG